MSRKSENKSIPFFIELQNTSHVYAIEIRKRPNCSMQLETDELLEKLLTQPACSGYYTSYPAGQIRCYCKRDFTVLRLLKSIQAINRLEGIYKNHSSQS